MTRDSFSQFSVLLDFIFVFISLTQGVFILKGFLFDEVLFGAGGCKSVRKVYLLRLCLK